MLSPEFSQKDTIRKYRLTPYDLPRGTVQARVTNVAVIGLESLTLLLHLDRFAKPLAIPAGEAQTLTAQLAHTAHSPTFQDWVGQLVTLQVATVDDVPTILVMPLRDDEENQPAASRVTPLATLAVMLVDSSVLTPILLIIVMVLALLGVALIENSDFFAQLFAR